MTDSEILILVDRLERCLFAPNQFHHHDHLAVAVTYLYSAGFEEAMDKIRASLARFIAHHGASGYNETLTRFWMIQVEMNMDRNRCLCDSVRQVVAVLSDKNFIYEFYTKERLNSPEAKARWVEPDLKSMAGVTS